MDLTENQKIYVGLLLSGGLSSVKFGQMRSNARRYRHLQKSIDYAVAYEVYKDRLKDGEKGEKTGK